MKPPIADLFKQIVVTLTVALVVVLTDVLYFGILYGGKFPRGPKAFVETIAIFFLLSFSFRPRGLKLSAIALLGFTFAQMLVVTYFGSFTQPIQFILLFSQMHETLETVSTITSSLILPTIVIAVAIGLVILLFKRFSYQGRRVPGLRWFVLIALSYSPIRTYVTGNNYGKQPAVNTLAYSNFYGSLSYLFGKVIPSRSQLPKEVPPVEKPPIVWARPQHHVIFVIGESLRYKNMQVFGYERPTTPRLSARLKNQDIEVRKAVSGGVSTDISVPLLINNLPDSLALLTTQGQSRCLFQLARENGFGTSFISAQGQQDLKYITNYICPKDIDYYKTRDDDQNVDGDALLLDDLLLQEAKNISFAQPQFVILHQRGSHSPYEKRYPESFRQFEPTADQDPRIAQYDNSVLYTDYLLDALMETIEKQSSLPVILIFTSDHGEALGEGGAWGHVMLMQEALEVPFVYWQSTQHSSRALTTIRKDIRAWPEFINHKNISDLVVRTLGYGKIEAPRDPQVSRVMGPDMMGAAGQLEVTTSAGRIQEIKVR